MNVTFMIGNGFDRNLGLDTAYSDFVKYYKETKGKTDILKDFRNYIKANEELWSAAEIEMGKYTGKFEAGQGAAFSECHNDFCEYLSEYLKEQERRIDYDYVAGEIEKAFLELITIANAFPTQEREVISRVFASHKSEDTVYNFINYNYTNTLDRCVSQIKNKQKVLGNYRYINTTNSHVLGEVQHVHNDGSGIDIIKDFSIVPALSGCERVHDSQKYIDNLVRLGLLERSSLSSLSNKALYNDLKMASFFAQYNKVELAKKRGFTKCEIEEGFVDLTAYGKSFCSICLGITKTVVVKPL